MELEPANLGRIAAYYYLSYTTLDSFSQALSQTADQQVKLKHLIEILSRASEFESIPIRQGEAAVMNSLVPFLTYPIESQDRGFNKPDNKTNMLLQCHFNRAPLNADLRID